MSLSHLDEPHGLIWTNHTAGLDTLRQFEAPQRLLSAALFLIQHAVACRLPTGLDQSPAAPSPVLRSSADMTGVR